MKIVTDDPDTPMLPVGCIGSHALQSLARSIRMLEVHHGMMGGASEHTPCLRKIESSCGSIIAFVSTGDVAWQKLTYDSKTKVWFLER